MNVLADAASYASASASVSSAASNSMPPKKNALKKKAPKLQHILMKLLNDESNPEAIWWLPGEKEFAINADKFPAVLDAHLPGTKYASFIRRLHKLGFSRQTRSLKKVYGTLPEHAVAFHHEKFRRDRPELMEELKNGYWKEAKARKSRGEASVTTRSPSPPPAVVGVPVSSLSLSDTPKKPGPPGQQTANELLEYAEALRQKNLVEQNEREVQLMLLRQRVAQEQAEMEQLLLLRQQRFQQEHFFAVLQQQQQQEQWVAAQAAGAEGATPPDTSSLLKMQLLQQQQAPFGGFVPGFARMY
jgi:HSF-type DNA-binding